MKFEEGQISRSPGEGSSGSQSSIYYQTYGWNSIFQQPLWSCQHTVPSRDRYSSTYILEHLPVRKKRKNTFLEEHTGTFIHQCSTLWRARPIPQTPVLRTNTTQTQAGSSDDLLFYSLEQMPESKRHKGLRVAALPTTKTGIQTAGGYVPWVCLG